MNLFDLTDRHEKTLPRLYAMHRIQHTNITEHTIVVGPVYLGPLEMTARFDLRDVPVGYFAKTPQTAAYETIARREEVFISKGRVSTKSLLSVELVEPVKLLDLRPHTPNFPVLTSLRLTHTRNLASDAARHGYDGLIYYSAQQYGHDCYALFLPALEKLRLVQCMPLVDPATGALHRLVQDVARGAQLEVFP